jgi:hypothetical protein
LERETGSEQRLGPASPRSRATNAAVDASQQFVGPRNEAGRYPRFTSLDMQVTKDVAIPFRGKRFKMRAGLKFFNVTNHWNPRDVQNNVASPEAGTFYNRIGRTVRLKFEFLDF